MGPERGQKARASLISPAPLPRGQTGRARERGMVRSPGMLAFVYIRACLVCLSRLSAPNFISARLRSLSSFTHSCVAPRQAPVTFVWPCLFDTGRSSPPRICTCRRQRFFGPAERWEPFSCLVLRGRPCQTSRARRLRNAGPATRALAVRSAPTAARIT